MTRVLESLRDGIESSFARITRTTLALFAGASGDHHPVHIDTDFARAAGHDDIIAHGGLTISLVMKALVDHVPQQRVRSLKARFLASAPPNAEPRSRVKLIGIEEIGDETIASVSIDLFLQNGTQIIAAQATFVT